MMTILPVFKGYTVDYRLREFRKVNYGILGSLEFISFDSEEGDELLAEMIGQDLVPQEMLSTLF